MKKQNELKESNCIYYIRMIKRDIRAYHRFFFDEIIIENGKKRTTNESTKQ